MSDAFKQSAPFILFVVNGHLYTAKHRLPLLYAAKDRGWTVAVIAPDESEAKIELEAHGFTCYPLRLSRRGTNPFAEMRGLFSLVYRYRQLNPDLIYHATIKPVLYGSIAARLARVPAVVNAITGLGYVYTSDTFAARAVRRCVNLLYNRAFLHRNARVIFQNSDDMETLLSYTCYPRYEPILIPGSGVDTDEFTPVAEPEKTTVTFVGRMLKEKGVFEFVEAANLCEHHLSDTRFVLVGGLDLENPGGIPQSQIKQWVAESAVEWWGSQSDMKQVYANSTIIVLPSYREGMPKVLLEAAACGRAVVTTDSSGCRDAVLHRQTGLIVPVGDTRALAEAITELLSDRQKREHFAVAARDRVVREHSVPVIIRQTFEVFDDLIASGA